MGLYASFTVEQQGFPLELSQVVLGEELWVEIDYSAALQDAVDTFINAAVDLVPVDTGYLQSTISASCDSYSVEFEATAEYAQYPEFGTWCQAAQPYFTPALEEAVAVFIEGAYEAYEWAQDELQDMIDEVIAEYEEEQSAMGAGFGGGGESIGSMLAGAAIAAVMFFLFFPVLVIGYGIVDTIKTAFTGEGLGNSYPGGGYYVPEVIIT